MRYCLLAVRMFVDCWNLAAARMPLTCVRYTPFTCVRYMPLTCVRYSSTALLQEQHQCIMEAVAYPQYGSSMPTV